MIILIPIVRLKKHANPFKGHPWGCQVTKKHVSKALQERRFSSQPLPVEKRAEVCAHASRIAWLVMYEASDPISIDVGVPSLQCIPKWFIEDGNHRLAAAIYANKTHIPAEISGDLDYAQELFGVCCY